MGMYFNVHEKCPKMPIRETDKLIRVLTDIRDTTTMKTARFGSIGDETKTQEIEELTRLWRNTWIIGPLEELIERYENAIKEQRDKNG